MLKYTPSLAVILLAIFFQSCSQEIKIPTQTIELTDTTDYAIADFQLIGPFYSDTINGDTVIDYNNLQVLGLDDTSIELEQLSKVRVKKKDKFFTTPEEISQFYSNGPGMIDMSMLYEPKNSSNKYAANIYAACVIESDKEQDVVFLTGGDEHAKLYLNGELIYLPVQNMYRLVFQNYKFARLKKGKNFLFLKIPNTTKYWLPEDQDEPWRFMINICTPKRYNDYYLQLEKVFIKRTVVPFQHPLVLDRKVHSIDKVEKVEITDYNNNVVLAPEYSDSIYLPGLEQGFYRLNMYTKTNSYTHNFFYGDIHTAIEPYIEKANKIINSGKGSAARNNLGALVKRYGILAGFYGKKDFFRITQSANGQNFKLVDSTYIKTPRFYELNKPKQVKMSDIRSEKYLVIESEFYKKNGNGIERVTFNQINEYFEPEPYASNKPNGYSYKKKWYPTIDTLIFEFDEENRPDYIQLITDNDIYLQEIERRYVFLYKELREIVSDISLNKDPFKNKPGVHVRGFSSTVDNGAQYYIVQSPSNLKDDGKARPLVVFTPWVVGDHMPFLRSPSIADVHVHEMIEWLVTNEDVIAVFPNARTFNHVVTTPISLNNVLLTIEDVKKDYNIDPTQIHLMAYCGGADVAITLATKYPGRFASVGVVAGFVMSPFNRYSATNFPWNFTENLIRIPKKIVHGELDHHTPKDNIEQFIEVAKKNGNAGLELEVEPEMTFEAYPKLRHQQEQFAFFANNSVETPKEFVYSTALHKYHRAFWIDLFPIASGVKSTIQVSARDNLININVSKAKQFVIHTDLAPIDRTKELKVVVNNKNYDFRPPYPVELAITMSQTSSNALTKNKYVEGPVVDVFDDKFIIVKGTTGPSLQRAHGDRLANNLIETWKASYYVEPYVKNDSEITARDIQESNLILVGNQHTNKLIREMYRELPLQIGPNYLKLGEKKFNGSTLGYSVVYPNPKNPAKYVVLFGGNDLSRTIYSIGNPAENGFFDYDIFIYQNNKPYIVEQGFFNENWELKEK